MSVFSGEDQIATVKGPMISKYLYCVLAILGIAQPLGILCNISWLKQIGAMSLASPAPNPLSKLKFDYLATADRAATTLFSNEDKSSTITSHEWKSELAGPHRVRVVYLMADYMYASYQNENARRSLVEMFCIDDKIKNRFFQNSEIEKFSIIFDTNDPSNAIEINCK